MRRLDANRLFITDHASKRFIDRYRKKNPFTRKTDGEILTTMRSFINKAVLRQAWEWIRRPDLYEYRQHHQASCYCHKGWIFVVGDFEDRRRRVLLTCKRIKKEQN